MLTLDELRADPAIDTVIMAFTDMQGRLLGKRLHRDFFFEQVDHGHGTEGCNYLLAIEMEMEPVPGYELASWERGYGDFELVPDLATMRRIPWLEGTALVLCDVAWGDGSPVRPSLRQVLPCPVGAARAGARLRREGRLLSSSSICLQETAEQAHNQHYRNLTPSVPYILDYHILAATYSDAAAAADPERDARQRACGSRRPSGRGVAGPAGDQLPLRRRAGRWPTTTSSTRTVRRRSAHPERLLDHVHGEAGSHVDQQSRHIHSSLWRGEESVFAGESDIFRQYSSRGIDRVRSSELAVLLRAEHQLVQAVRGRARGRRRRLRGGQRQPHVA